MARKKKAIKKKASLKKEAPRRAFKMGRKAARKVKRSASTGARILREAIK